LILNLVVVDGGEEASSPTGGTKAPAPEDIGALLQGRGTDRMESLETKSYAGGGGPCLNRLFFNRKTAQSRSRVTQGKGGNGGGGSSASRRGGDKGEKSTWDIGLIARKGVPPLNHPEGSNLVPRSGKRDVRKLSVNRMQS